MTQQLPEHELKVYYLRVLEVSTKKACNITSLHHFIQQESLPLHQGRIIANGDMSVKGLSGVWALGDCAIVPNAYNDRNCPPTAQFAERQAKYLAKNTIPNKKIKGIRVDKLPV